MVARIPFPFLKPCAFSEHAEDVALIYRDKFAAGAAGEIAWMLHCIGDEAMRPAVADVVAHALRMAAMLVEARHAGSAVALGNQSESEA